MSEFLDDLRVTMTAHAIDATTAQSIINTMCETWKGCPAYIPKNTKLEKERMHAEIKRRFDGANHSQLCHEFDLSLSQVYRILKIKTN